MALADDFRVDDSGTCGSVVLASRCTASGIWAESCQPASNIHFEGYCRNLMFYLPSNASEHFDGVSALYRGLSLAAI